jgi:hypothetical protein
MADAEILQGEIEALQEAVLSTDQRIDEITEEPTTDTGDLTQQCLGRIEATLQQVSSCLERLEQRSQEQMTAISSQVEEATMAAEAAAVMAAESALVAAENTAEEAGSNEVIEVEPAPPPPSEEKDESKSRSPSLWERLLGSK